MLIQFTIPLSPKPSNKRHAFVIGGHARVVQDRGVVEHQAQIAACAAQHRPATVIDGPVMVEILAVMPRPASLCVTSKRTGQPLQSPCRWPHTSRPDADNLAKSVLDGLRAWWGDDAQVCDLRVRKVIAAFGEAAHYAVNVRWGEDLP
jgi:Holliday junction resolvase RusA-like endonuclease